MSARNLLSKTKKQSSRRRGRGPKKLSAMYAATDVPDSFEDLIENSDLRRKFRMFLEARVAVECLNLYESIELYEQVTTPHLREKAGKYIIEEYIKEDARYWVNVPSSTREDLLQLRSFEPESFSSAKRSMFELMSTNFFADFKKEVIGSAKSTAPTLSFDNATIYRANTSFTELSQSFGLARSSSVPIEAVWPDDVPDEDTSEVGTGKKGSVLERTSTSRKAEETGDSNADRGSINRRAAKFGKLKRGSVFLSSFKKSSSTVSNSPTQSLPSGQSKKSLRQRFLARPVSTKERRPSHLENPVWSEIEQFQKLVYKH